jgi:hypothetical protein
MTFEEWQKKWGVPRVGVVGDGWVGILETLAQEAAAKGFDFKDVVQIKEKFGGLRFYYHSDVDISEEVDRAEAAAIKTCETCGAPGKPRSGGWILTLCDAHAGGRE